jgi:hypothetical protein
MFGFVLAARALVALSAPPPTSGAHAAEKTEGTAKVVAKLEPPQPVVLDQPHVTVVLPLPEGAQASIHQAVSAKAGRVLLNIVGIDYEKNPGAGYEIYLNLPAGAADSRDTAHYAGVLHFYNLKEAAQASGKPAEVDFDITEQVRQLEQSRQWSSQELRVTFVRRGAVPPAGHKEQAPVPGAIARFSALELIVE